MPDPLHVHVVEGSPVPPEGSEQKNAANPWISRRKAKPTEFLLPRTVRWMATLPLEFQPTATGEAFPRIANALAGVWFAPELTSYLDDLLASKRGRRQGFPVRVLGELHALRAYRATFLTAPAGETNRRLSVR